MKDCLSCIFQWDRNLLEGITPESRFWREQPDIWWSEKLDIPGFTPRMAMTIFGTLMRNHFDKNIWVRTLERRLANIDKVVITDCRFINEIKMIRNHDGIIVRIKRGDDPSWMSIAKLANAGDEQACKHMKELEIHESEWNWVNETPDITILNDGTIAKLHNNVTKFFDPNR